MNATWTIRELNIVEALTRHVRLLDIEQIVRIWWTEALSHRTARRRLRRLAEADLLTCHTVNACRLKQCSSPLATWVPSEPEPDCGRLSREAQSRWPLAATAREVYVATRRAANIFASSSHGVPPIEHRDHDLLLADAYVHHRQHSISGMRWLGEHALPKAGYRIKDPDAFLVDEHGNVARAIESAGRYSRKQFETFHDHCASLNVPYEIW